MLEIPKFNFNNNEWITEKKLFGKSLANLIVEHIKEDLKKYDKQPGLAALIIGEYAPSQIYVSNKEKKAKEAGFYFELANIKNHTSQEEVLQIIENFNTNPKIHGILAQLPFPNHLNQNAILQAISLNKDADGFHFENLGKLMAKEVGTIPCTPFGIAVMLKQLDINLTGKHAVVLGRSTIVGKPMAQILLDEFNCTVTICHSKTQNLDKIISTADILVSAMGQRNIINYESIKEGSIVIDVGIHRDENGLVCGDLDLNKIEDKILFGTPVPGGVGPMTIAMLLYNTYKNFIRSLK